MNNSNDGLCLHVVFAVQDNCVDSKLLKLASEDRMPIYCMYTTTYNVLRDTYYTEYCSTYYKFYVFITVHAVLNTDVRIRYL